MANPNLVVQCDRAYVAPASLPAAPGNNVTRVMFTTHPRATGGSGAVVQPPTYQRANGQEAVAISPDAIKRVKLVYHLHDQASAANGLRAYQTLDGGTTWFETDMKGYVAGVANQPSIGAAAPIQVPALSAGQEWVEEFEIDRYRGFCLEHTAGATGPTPTTGWGVTVMVEYAAQGGQ